MYRFFFDKKVINVGTHRNFEDISSNNNVYTYKEGINLRPIIERFIRDKETDEIYIINTDENAFWKDVFLNFKYREAAGGVVFNEKEEVLVIKRWDKWDLPKGGIKKGENSRNAAMREVEEETAIDQLKITGILPLSFHLYAQKENLYLKKTYWYAMKTTSTKVPEPQKEEDIEIAKWINKKELNLIKKDTWDSLLDVWKEIN